RGVSLLELMQMDVQALSKVLPRITSPSLTPQEVSAMDPADLMACGVTVSGFLLQKSAKEASLVA
ncbi:phage tail assembly protein, partial [Pseudomonas aeruginosa]